MLPIGTVRISLAHEGAPSRPTMFGACQPGGAQRVATELGVASTASVCSERCTAPAEGGPCRRSAPCFRRSIGGRHRLAPDRTLNVTAP